MLMKDLVIINEFGGERIPYAPCTPRRGRFLPYCCPPAYSRSSHLRPTPLLPLQWPLSPRQNSRCILSSRPRMLTWNLDVTAGSGMKISALFSTALLVLGRS
ncbi:hypothetical protein PLICRDRAFT_516753 [Plicaturopsis crispa FD-325 SS-3]|nr:hypothetical protein PLICRDRAFT_516753 [Plicaturopsis crispa FD-325 SS-3]